MITVEADFGPALRMVGGMEKQAAYAAAVTLTRLAKRTQLSLQQEMARRFDRPTLWTLRSTFTSPATKARLWAVTGMKTSLAGKARRSAAEILEHEFSGGRRERKPIEQWLTRAGLLGGNEYIVPGAGAKLDRHGNMSRGQVQQILSQLRAGPDSATYSTKSTRSRRNVKRSGRIFWSRGGNLPRGAWIMTGKYAVMPLLVPVGSTTYRRRIDLIDIATRIARQYASHEFGVAMDQALATAR